MLFLFRQKIMPLIKFWINQWSEFERLFILFLRLWIKSKQVLSYFEYEEIVHTLNWGAPVSLQSWTVFTARPCTSELNSPTHCSTTCSEWKPIQWCAFCFSPTLKGSAVEQSSCLNKVVFARWGRRLHFRFSWQGGGGTEQEAAQWKTGVQNTT